MKEITVPVTEFKAKCLRMLDDVEKKGDRIVITKRGRRIAEVKPVPEEKPKLGGTLKGKARILGDIVNFHDDPWEVESE